MDDSFLKACKDVEPLWIFTGLDFVFRREISFTDQPKYGSLDAAETEVEGTVADFRNRKRMRVSIAEFRQTIDDRTSRILKSEQTSYLVVGLAGCVIPSSPDE